MLSDNGPGGNNALNPTATPALLLALLLLLLVVAFSAGTEVAMLSVNRYRIRHRAQAGSGTAQTLSKGCSRGPTSGWARTW